MSNDYKDLVDSMVKAGYTREQVLKAMVDGMKPDLDEDFSTVTYLTEEQKAIPEMWSGDFPSIMDGFFSAKGTSDRETPDYYDLAKYLIKAKGCRSNGNYTWLYDNGKYDLLKKEQLQNYITELTLEKTNMNQINQFLGILIAKSQCKDDELKQIEHKINLANGVLDLKTKEMLPHSKDYFFKYKLPIKYEPMADCPLFKKYLNETFEGDEEMINVTAEIFGYCLYGGEPFLHKSFVLFGEGRNGKSVWLHVLRHLLGHANVSTVSMSLLSKPFSVIQMDGKLANITGELPNGKLDSELFKTACGGEYITAAHKGKDEFGLKVNAKLVFASNKFPMFGDTTTGMWEKLFIMPFSRYLRPEDRDPTIFKRLEGELPGILNFALKGLSAVLKRGRIIEPLAVKKMMAEYRKESDSVYCWMLERLTVTGNYGDVMTAKQLHDQYTNDMFREGRKAYKIRMFGKRLNAIIKEQNLKVNRIRDQNFIKYDGIVCNVNPGGLINVLRLGAKKE